MKPACVHAVPMPERAEDLALAVANDGALSALLAEGRHVEAWWLVEGRQPRMMLLLGPPAPPAPEPPPVPAPPPWWGRGARTVDVLITGALLVVAVLVAGLAR